MLSQGTPAWDGLPQATLIDLGCKQLGAGRKVFGARSLRRPCHALGEFRVIRMLLVGYRRLPRGDVLAVD
jgi:hypothetical protein